MVAEQFQNMCAERTRERAQRYVYAERQRVEPTALDERLVGVLERAADALGASSRRMHSGAAHDTMFVARRAPAAMVFVPCRDGISHAPQEWADPAQAALAAHVALCAVEELSA
jgi:acetylornithine deacetylase/succinyl-diaminopimelate desuccinylase-like protein